MEELDMEPRGLLWQDDFITPEHEQRLISTFRHELAWPDRPGRLSLHYGYHFDYRTFGVDPDIPYTPFPAWLEPLVPQLATAGGRRPDQVCLQYYAPGTGIPPHSDMHSPWDELCALSLGAPVVMQFRRGDARVDVDLKPRSLVQMTGDARLHWTHGIKKRKSDVVVVVRAEGEGEGEGEVREVRRPRGDRWSLTYRWLRDGGECECGDEALCDTAQRRKGVRWRFRSAQEEGEGPSRQAEAG